MNDSENGNAGIFLPTSATSSPLPEATVIVIGPVAPDIEGRVVPTSVKAGNRALLPGWGGNAIKVGEDVRWFSLLIFVSFSGLEVLIGPFLFCRNTSFSKMLRFWLRLRSRVGATAYACAYE